MQKIRITEIKNSSEADICTQIMATSKPWITLKLTYEKLIKLFDDSNNLVFIAKENNEILGFVIINMIGTFKGYIKILAVSDKARGGKIGTKLMDFAEDFIFRQTPNVFICVSSFNKKAQKFYFNRGYKLVGKLENFLLEGYHELLIRKTISPLNGYKHNHE